MTIATVEEPLECTLEDLLRDLGVGPERIIAGPAEGRATVADVIRLGDALDKRFCELIEGVLVEKETSLEKAVLGAELVFLIHGWPSTRQLGVVFGPGCPFQLFERIVRLPDIGFIAWDSMPGRRIPRVKIVTFPPDLAVEILSASNTKGEIALKLEHYFAAGVKLVWIADPETRTVKSYSSPDAFESFSGSDEVPGEPILPGFRLKISEWFAALDRCGPNDDNQ